MSAMLGGGVYTDNLINKKISIRYALVMIDKR